MLPSQHQIADNLGTICTVISCGIAGFQIMQHLRYYTQPQIQLQIIRILAIIPVGAARQETNRLVCRFTPSRR